MYDYDFQKLTIVVGALAIPVSAFCIWLTVRIINRLEPWTIDLAIWLAVACVLAAALFFSIPVVHS